MPQLLSNKFPEIEQDYRLAIVGYSPDYDSVATGNPFSGTPGRFLQSALSQAQILQSACFTGYIINHTETKVYDYAKKATLPERSEIQAESIKKLRADLKAFNPHAILVLGDDALRHAGVFHSLSSFRGSIFLCNNTDSAFFGYKCIASIDPEKLIRQYDLSPLFVFDVKRAKQQAHFSELRIPQRTFHVEQTASQICHKLDSITSGTLTSIDIEGGVPNPEATSPEYRFPSGITCIGVATNPLEAFIVNIHDFEIQDQKRIFTSLARVLCDDTIPKVLQNSLYDNFALSWVWKMPIKNVFWDTMLGNWQIYPELPKGLGTQTSIWTEQPYYKFERKVNDQLTHYRYCCMDAAVTLEIAQKQMAYLKLRPKAEAHHNFNMSLLPALHYMELRGIKYDKAKADEQLADVTHTLSMMQNEIDIMAGGALNVNSPKQMTETLYKRLGFEPQYVVEKGRKTSRTTTDADALLNLYKKTSSPLIYSILRYRQLDSQRKQLSIPTDPDGRMRCSYNLVGTETGRLSCGESPTGSGTNLQTIMKSLRKVYVADEGKVMFECDLSGADGWTVAAHCRDLGDDTMWDDYEYGIKPALVIAAMYAQGPGINRLDRGSLLKFLDSAKDDFPKWLYPASKAVQHGSNYGMGTTTMSKNILLRSWKDSGVPMHVDAASCAKLQKLYLDHRYTGIVKWQERVKQTLSKTGQLECPSGHTRTFFGRRSDNATYQAAYSQEPQANTTYITNRALYNLWNDPENRDSRGYLIIEPLHQVHDALIGQFDISRTEWALEKIRSWFNNPIVIARQKLTIPFEGAYGPSWGEHPNKI